MEQHFRSTKNAQVVLIIMALTVSGCLTNEESGDLPAQEQPAPVNGAPSIWGDPQSAVLMGDGYSFVPNASDPNGDTLTFTVINLPVWASFNSSTGAISGQPSLGNVGLFQGISISVTDGVNTVSLPSFSIEVFQAALGSMTISWTPPSQNTDGSALTNLAGYRIYYGETPGNYPNRIDITTTGISAHVVDNLLPKTYYVVATSVNSAGIESAYSNMAIKTVDGG